jgi:hypothetical protein
MEPKCTWEIIGICRTPSEVMLTIERLATHTIPKRNLTERSIIGGDMNLPRADWKGDAEKASGFQACVNRNRKWMSKPKDSGKPHYTTSRRKRPPQDHTDNSSPHK